MKLVVPANACCQRGDSLAWDDQAHLVETVLWHHPRKGHEKRRRCRHEARPVDQYRAASVGFGELTRLDLNADGPPRRQAPDDDLVGLVVGKRPEQPAVFEEGKAADHLELTPRTDPPILVG